MTTLEAARAYDAVDDVVDAAAAYEEVVAGEACSLDAILDLAVLYLDCCDFGTQGQHQLDKFFVDRAWKRIDELLRQAETSFGSSNEVEFWRYYFGYLYKGDSADKELTQALAAKGPSLVPYFHLLAFDEAPDVLAHANKLYDIVKEGSTARSRYIKSVLESAFTRVLQSRGHWPRRDERQAKGGRI